MSFFSVLFLSKKRNSLLSIISISLSGRVGWRVVEREERNEEKKRERLGGREEGETREDQEGRY
jgi:hypothetical protein